MNKLKYFTRICLEKIITQSAQIANIDLFYLLEKKLDLDYSKKIKRRLPTKRSALYFLSKNNLDIQTIIDVGVQHKTQELIEIFPNLKHILFEPVEEYHPFIEKAYSGLDYTLVKTAVSNEDGEATLSINRLGMEDISHSAIIKSNHGTENRVVKTVTLDSFFEDKNYDLPYLLKIDVDGYEIPILEGAEETLKNTSCVIIEANILALPERINFLTERGFKLWDIVDICYYHDNLSQVDLIFLRETEKEKPVFSPWQNFNVTWDKWKPFLPNM